MYSLRTSQFVDKRFGEKSVGLSEAEKFSHRLRMVRKKQNKRASKYSLDKETDLTHFGKRIADMDKSDIRGAYIGMEDEEDDKPFSYDSLIAKSKEERAEARKKKMEAEAELEDLDQSFGSLFTSLEHRDIDRDKLEASKLQGEDDLAFIARSFQMENIQKAPATDRSKSEAELKAQRAEAEKATHLTKAAIASENVFDEDGVDEDDVIVESDQSDNEALPVESESTLSTDPILIQTMRQLITRNSLVISRNDQERLLEQAKSTPSEIIDDFFKFELFDKSEKNLVLIKIASILFPLGFQRHCIAVPILKVLEQLALEQSAGMSHLILLHDYLVEGPKFSPTFFALAGRLWRSVSEPDTKDDILTLVSSYCSSFTRESLHGVIERFFPELSDMIRDESPFIPLKLHQFKPVEVLSLEPAFHEEGEEWNGNHKELREAKKLQQQYKKDKRLTAKEMRKEARATEGFAALQKQKEKEKVELARKRFAAKMQEAEEGFRFTKTDNGKEKFVERKKKKPRLGGNKM